jgi:hypothetical protein
MVEVAADRITEVEAFSRERHKLRREVEKLCGAKTLMPVRAETGQDQITSTNYPNSGGVSHFCPNLRSQCFGLIVNEPAGVNVYSPKYTLSPML